MAVQIRLGSDPVSGTDAGTGRRRSRASRRSNEYDRQHEGPQKLAGSGAPVQCGNWPAVVGAKNSAGEVLLLDNELHAETIQNRLASVANAMGVQPVTDDGSFIYCDVRGKAVDIYDIERELSRFSPGELTLVCLDAKYRFFGADENSNAAQTEFHNRIDRLAGQLNCVIVLIHHATKRSVWQIRNGHRGRWWRAVTRG